MTQVLQLNRVVLPINSSSTAPIRNIPEVRNRVN
jgi:hypothetical protein